MAGDTAYIKEILVLTNENQTCHSHKDYEFCFLAFFSNKYQNKVI